MPGEAMSRSGGGAAQPVAKSLNAGAVHPAWIQLQDHLEEVKSSILAEIRHYPPPIAGCDQQFNHLLEQRSRIARALGRVASIRQGDPATEADLAALLAFVHEASSIGDPLKAHLVALLQQGAPSSVG
jgi:hypothetical protein